MVAAVASFIDQAVVYDRSKTGRPEAKALEKAKMDEEADEEEAER